MTARSCQSCKHYEPSAMWRRGWCRNPRLYSPQQSHMVDQDSLDCSRGLGSAWESADADRSNAASTGRQPLRLFASQPRLALAGADQGMMASSDVGGGSGSGGGSYSGSPRGDRTTGQERTVSYQPEERYWTDYLRIALPVVGLLVLLGVFWYWGTSIIGGGEGDPPATEVAVGAVTEVNAPVASPAATAPPADVNANAGAPPATPPAQQAAQAQPSAQVAASQETQAADPAEPAEPAAAGADAPESNPGSTTIPPFDVGSTALADGVVNVRAEPSAGDGVEIVEELPDGAPVTISAEQVPDADGGDNEWYLVETEAGNSGYVREDLLQPAE